MFAVYGNRLLRQMLDGIAAINEDHHCEVGDPETESRIPQYEMAFRMQTSVPQLMDVSGESQRTLELYGPEVVPHGKRPCSAAAKAGPRHQPHRSHETAISVRPRQR
jgi:hypothetical protein